MILIQYHLINLYVKSEDIENAVKELKLLESIKNVYKISSFKIWINNLYNITKALVLIKQNTLQSKSQAQKLLEGVVYQSKDKTELIIEALLPLIELTIQEFKIFKNNLIVDKIENLLDIFRDLTENHNSIPMRLQYLTLDGTLKLYSGHYKEFELNFSKARELAREYELTALQNWIDDELSNFYSELNDWQKLMSS